MSDNERQYRLEASRRSWNRAAATFDEEPDHGLRDPVVRDAWMTLLTALLPLDTAMILDMGCGTGSLSMVLAESGHNVTGIDFSPAMIDLARKKADVAGYDVLFRVMDASAPQFPPQQFDALICRHLLWALPEPDTVLRRWVQLLRPGGFLLMIEGYWHTNAGLHAEEIMSVLPGSLKDVLLQNLSDHADLWGGTVPDERYVIRATYRG